MLVLNTTSPPTAPCPVSASPRNAAPSSRTMTAGLGKVLPGHAAGGQGELDPGRELVAEPGRVERARLQAVGAHRPLRLGIHDAQVGDGAGAHAGRREAGDARRRRAHAGDQGPEVDRLAVSYTHLRAHE